MEKGGLGHGQAAGYPGPMDIIAGGNANVTIGRFSVNRGRRDDPDDGDEPEQEGPNPSPRAVRPQCGDLHKSARSNYVADAFSAFPTQLVLERIR